MADIGNGPDINMGKIQQILAGYGPSGGAGPSGPLLDDLSVMPNRAYSFQKLRAGYSGACCKAGTAHPPTVDIPFDGEWIDEDALFADDDNPFVLFYDQGTNGNHETQLPGNFIAQASANEINGKPGLISPQGASYTNYGNLSAFTAGEMHLLIKRAADPPISGQGTLHLMGTSGNTTHIPYLDGNGYDDFLSTVRKSLGDHSLNMASWRLYSVWSASNDWAAMLNGSHFPNSPFSSNTVSGNTGSYQVRENTLTVAGFNLLFSQKLTAPDRAIIFAHIQDAANYNLSF